MRKTGSQAMQILKESQGLWPSPAILPQQLVSLRGMAKPAVSRAALDRAIQRVRRALKVR